MKTYGLEVGDLLLNEASGSPNEVGKPAIWMGEIEDCAFQNTLLRVRPTDRVDPRYLLHYLHEQAVTAAFARGSRGVGIHHLGREALSKWPVPLPPLDEQRRIAAILDQADAVRKKRWAVLRHLDDLRTSVFSGMFGDPVASSGATRLADIADIQIGPFGSLLHKQDYVTGGVPLINPTHIVNGGIRPDPDFSVSAEKAASIDSYILRVGDVVMGRRGEMGRCAVVGVEHDGYLCGTGSLIVRPRPGIADSVYLHAALSHPSTKSLLERLALGSTLPNLNAAIVSGLPILAPPPIDQQRFRASLEQLSDQSQLSQRALADLDNLFASLQSRAFRGELSGNSAGSTAVTSQIG